MTDPSPAIDELAKRARQLPPAERVMLIERVIAELNQDADATPPRRSLLGLWADYGTAPSAEDIDEARRAAWHGFPRDIK